MRILQIPPGVYPISSTNKALAIEEIIFQLCNRLSEKNCKVYLIDIQTNRPNQQFSATVERILNICPCEEVISRFAFNVKAIFFALLYLPTLIKISREKNIELIHTHYSYSALTAILIGKWILKIPVVHTTHAHDLIMTPTITNRLKGFSEYLVLKFSSLIIAPTPSVKKRLIREFGIDTNKITVIFGGSDLSHQLPLNTDHQHHIKSSNVDVILCVGRISRRKNQLSVINAIPTVLNQFKNIRFVFVGPINEPEYYTSVLNAVNEKRIGPWVSFCGEISRMKLIQLYREASIFIFPTLAEIQGIALVEALSFGIPTIASKIEPIIDIADIEKDGILLIDPNDSNDIAQKIIFLLKNPELRRSMSYKGELIARNFSWDDIAERTFQVYQTVLEREAIGRV